MEKALFEFCYETLSAKILVYPVFVLSVPLWKNFLFATMQGCELIYVKTERSSCGCDRCKQWYW